MTTPPSPGLAVSPTDASDAPARADPSEAIRALPKGWRSQAALREGRQKQDPAHGQQV